MALAGNGVMLNKGRCGPYDELISVLPVLRLRVKWLL